MNWTFAREIGLAKWAWRVLRRQVDKRLLRRDSQLLLPTGQPIVLARGSASASEVFVTDADTDWGAEALFARFADASRDLFDVGAHIGYYSLYLSPLVKRVWAFEPDRRNHAALSVNLALASNVTHVDSAVSTHSGALRLSVAGGSATSHVAAVGVEVAAVSIDDFTRDTGATPALIKIDVEGHDLAVLEGARGTLARHQPLVLMEFTQDNGDNDTGRLLALSAGLDYRAYAIVWMAGSGSLLGPRRRALAAFDAALAAATPVKMIFLVPARLHADFDELVRSGSPL